MEWYHFKEMLSTALGVSQDALHIFVGVGCQILLALLLRRRLAHLLPWLIVLGLAIFNEWSDLHAEVWPNRDAQLGESFKDLCVTMLLPTALLLLARFVPGLFGVRPAPEATRPPSGAGLESSNRSGARSAG